jgi:Asparagine synthase
LAQALCKAGVPPTSVVVFRNDDERIIPDDEHLHEATTYTARLIEGYDIEGVRSLFRSEFGAGEEPDADESHVLLKRRLSVDPTGALRMERNWFDAEDVVVHVRRTVGDTIRRYDLLPSDTPIVLGLSGGVDSGSLLMLLAADANERSDQPLRIVAGTFEDFDSRYSETFSNAAKLAARFEVEHRLIPADVAEHVFHLARPIAQLLMRLMETDDSHMAMYVDHHSTRRVLEVFADENDSSTVVLGLHATDLIAGMVNSWTSGHDVGPVPSRQVGPYRYVMPLCMVPKRELHLYYTAVTGAVPKQTVPNQWEFNPTDRNFHYFLADHLQWLWPGVQEAYRKLILKRWRARTVRKAWG